MLADELDYVIGVDTHRDEHVLAVLTAAGAGVAGEALPANARGYRETLRFAERYAAGRRAWAIEGTGSYGAGLARFLAGRGETVLEVSRTPRAERRLRGKDDTLDAARTARAALASDTLARPRWQRPAPQTSSTKCPPPRARGQGRTSPPSCPLVR
jgi:transposase